MPLIPWLGALTLFTVQKGPGGAMGGFVFGIEGPISDFGGMKTPRGIG